MAIKLIGWELKWVSKGTYKLIFDINQKEIEILEEKFGIRIIMTNRHRWETDKIIKAFHGQSDVERAFREMKNLFHMSVKPQFHWTDQKIRVHYFICIIGYLLSTLLWREVRVKLNFKGCMNTLFNMLKIIRLATIIQEDKKGKVKATYQLEEMDEEGNDLV